VYGFHPQEFILATNSTDMTMKFLDLETFEPNRSTGPKTIRVHAMIFNPDERTMLARLHESLKLFLGTFEMLGCSGCWLV